jgi:hypothetical protein
VALSYGLPVVASDIPANVEVGLPAEHYFPLDDVGALAARFDWRGIARRTLAVYRAAVE